MTCISAFAESMAMSTTQFARVIQDRVIQYEDAAPWQLENNGEKTPRMNWVVVTDKDGRRRLRILWSTEN